MLSSVLKKHPSCCFPSVDENNRPERLCTSQGTRAPDGLDIDDGCSGHPSASRGTQQGERPLHSTLAHTVG